MSNQKNNDQLLAKNAEGDEEKETSLARREQSEVGFSLQPRNLKEALKICEYLASSSLVPKQYQGNPQDVLVAINWGQEVGLKPLQSLNSVAVVNGTPSMYGAAPLALARQHPDFEWILEDNEAFAYARDNVKGWEHLKDKNPDDTSICIIKRSGEPPVVREFSKEDVKTAGLGNVHKSYPKDMRKYRARSRALEASFGDVLKGIHQAEIVEENQRLGVYDNDNEVLQPAERQTVDFDDPVTDSTNGNSGAEEPAGGEPENNTIDREGIMSEITARAKDLWPKAWLQNLKIEQRKLNEDADTMMDLSDSDLLELHDVILGMDVETEEA